MVVRRRGVMTAPIFICDLDFTLLRINSFPRWALHLVAGRLPGLGPVARARLSLRAQALLLRRKLGRIDHLTLLRGLQAAWHEAGAEAASGLEDRLLGEVRPALTPLLRRIAAGEIEAVLATAAAGEYALGLGRRLGFRHALATPFLGCPTDRPNEGEEKLRRVRLLFASQGWTARPRIVLTDHRNDLPLISHAHAVGWYGVPDDRPRLDAISCRALDAAATERALDALARQAQAAAGTLPASAAA